MSLFAFFIDFILHLDVHLQAIIQSYGIWTYALLFLIIFLETGLVFTPFLPGDSLLFAAGTFAALGSLNLNLLILLLVIAAILGDTINYNIGKFLGQKLMAMANHRFLKKEYFDYTERYFDKYGNKTIMIARFIPIVRTIAPFLAGVGMMPYLRFLSYNILGGLLWVFAFILGGYFFGNIPMVKENFTLVILGIIIVSLMPLFHRIYNAKFGKKDQQ